MIGTMVFLEFVVDEAHARFLRASTLPFSRVRSTRALGVGLCSPPVSAIAFGLVVDLAAGGSGSRRLRRSRFEVLHNEAMLSVALFLLICGLSLSGDGVHQDQRSCTYSGPWHCARSGHLDFPGGALSCRPRDRPALRATLKVFLLHPQGRFALHTCHSRLPEIKECRLVLATLTKRIGLSVGCRTTSRMWGMWQGTGRSQR